MTEKREKIYREDETKAREIEVTLQQNKKKERKWNRIIQRKIKRQQKISRRFRKAYINHQCDLLIWFTY